MTSIEFTNKLECNQHISPCWCPPVTHKTMTFLNEKPGYPSNLICKQRHLCSTEMCATKMEYPVQGRESTGHPQHWESSVYLTQLSELTETGRMEISVAKCISVRLLAQKIALSTYLKFGLRHIFMHRSTHQLFGQVKPVVISGDVGGWVKKWRRKNGHQNSLYNIVSCALKMGLTLRKNWIVTINMSTKNEWLPKCLS